MRSAQLFDQREEAPGAAGGAAAGEAPGDKYGYLDFLPAMRNFDLMVANRDQAIWSTAAGKPARPDAADLSRFRP